MRSNTAIAIGSVLFAFSIAGLLWVASQVKQLADFCYSIDRYKIKWDWDVVIVTLSLRIKNKSTIPIGVNSYNFDVVLNGAKMAQVKRPGGDSIAPKAITHLEIPIRIPIFKAGQEIKGNELLRLFKGKEYDKIVVSLKGSMNVGSDKLRTDIPVDYKITLKEIIKIMDEPASDPCM